MLDRLFMHTRPVVPFDPANSAHRRAVNTYVRTGGWGSTPMRFLLETPYLDVPNMVSSRLLNYYLSREFKQVEESQETVAN